MSEYQRTMGNPEVHGTPQKQVQSPYLRGVKNRGFNNPSYVSNEVFYSTPQKDSFLQVANQNVKAKAMDSTQLRTPPKNFDNSKKLDFHGDMNTTLFTEKKVGNQSLDATQATIKKERNDISYMPSHQDIINTTQKIYPQSKSPMRSNVGGGVKNAAPQGSKYTQLNPDFARYDSKTPNPKKSSYASFLEQQSNNLFTPQRPSSSHLQTNDYINHYASQKLIRVNGKLQPADAQVNTQPNQTSSLQESTNKGKHNRVRTEQDAMSLKSGTSKASSRRQNSELPEQSKAKQQQEKPQKTMKEVTFQPSKIIPRPVTAPSENIDIPITREAIQSIEHQQAPAFNIYDNWEKKQKEIEVKKKDKMSDTASVQSKRSSKSVYSKASSIRSNCSHASSCSSYMCDLCFNNKQIANKQYQKLLEKQKDMNLFNLKQQREKEEAERVYRAQKALRDEQAHEMNEFFQNQPSQLEKKSMETQMMNEKNQKLKEYQQILAQQEYEENRLCDKERKQYMKDVLTEQIKNQEKKKQFEKEEDKKYAYDGTYDSYLRKQEMERQQRVAKNLQDNLVRQMEERKAKANYNKEVEQKYHDMYEKIMKSADQDMEYLQKARQEQKQNYKKVLEDSIKYKIDREQQSRRKELQKLQKELKDIEDMNKKIAQNVYERDQQMKQNMRNTYDYQIQAKKQKEEQEKKIDSIYNQIPVQQPKKLPTGKCGTCKSEVLLSRLMKMKKNQKQ